LTKSGGEAKNSIAENIDFIELLRIGNRLTNLFIRNRPKGRGIEPEEMKGKI